MPRVLRRLESERVAEVEIQRHKTTIFLLAEGDQLAIRRRLQPLLGDGCHVVAGLSENRCATKPEVLIELQLRNAGHQPSSR